jgi:uncharacterized protein (TIRG00374 family)
MKKFSRIFIIVILSGLIIFALLRLGDINISIETLARVRWQWMLLVFAIFYSSIVVRGSRWQRILNTMGWPVKFVYAQTLLITGMFISAILPARVGDVGRVAMLKQDYKIPIAHGLASIATERALDIFSILTLAAIGTMWAVQGHIPPEIARLMLGAIILFIVGLTGLLAMPSLEKWLREYKWIKAVMPAPIWPLYQKVLDFGFSLIHGVRALGRRPVALGMAIVESLYIWLCDALIIHFILISIGLPTPLSVSLFSGMISALAAAVPFTPGALGQFDAVVIGTLALFGLATSHTSLAALLIRFVNFWTFMAVSGLVTYIFGFARALNLSRSEANPSRRSSTPARPAPNLAEGEA